MIARPLLALLAGALLAAPPALAADPAAPATATATIAPTTAAGSAPLTGSKQPIDITADQTLEWHRNDEQYVAYGHVIAIQGDSTSKADKMIADYRPKEGHPNGTGPIYRLTGIGHVILISKDDTSFGDKVVYNVDTGIGVLTGAHLLATSPEQTVTARDNFVYNNFTGQLTANGNARLVRPIQNGTGNDVITSDTMSAWFVRDDDAATPANNASAGNVPATKASTKSAPAKNPPTANSPTPTATAGKPAGSDQDGGTPGGKRHLDHMTADNHVVIITPTEIVHGDHATYDAATQIAIVTDHVRIDRGPNVMTGDKARVNMATNVSQMIAAPNSGKRVHALFYPGTSDASDPTNISHGDTSMPPIPSAASPGDVVTAIPPATPNPPLTVENAADPDIDTPLSTPRIGAP